MIKHVQEKELERNLRKPLQSSKIIDFIWVLCSCATTLKVPNWTGFNHMLHDKGEEEPIQFVTYLPAIDRSPTSPDTVLELLVQSKAKAEHLGLQETDVVVDQAIYAKAVEILANPTHRDLKTFIVLRMGAFHIASTFITVIGKRFGDGGLRDLMIEANIFGKCILTIIIYLFWDHNEMTLSKRFLKIFLYPPPCLG